MCLCVCACVRACVRVVRHHGWTAACTHTHTHTHTYAQTRTHTHLRLAHHHVNVQPGVELQLQGVHEWPGPCAPGWLENGDHGIDEAHVCEVGPLQQGVAQVELHSHGGVSTHREQCLCEAAAGQSVRLSRVNRMCAGEW
jgi:hypothetical protein